MDLNISSLVKTIFNLSSLPQDEQNSIVLKITFIVLIIQFITFISALIFQLYLKRQDVLVESRKIKSAKVIKLYQKLYSKIETVFNDINDRDEYQNENINMIKSCRLIISRNGLYFSDNANAILKDILDNLTIKIVTPSSFDYTKHSELIKKFKREFLKI